MDIYEDTRKLRDKYKRLGDYLQSLQKIELISDDANHNDALNYAINSIRKKMKKIDLIVLEKWRK